MTLARATLDNIQSLVNDGNIDEVESLVTPLVERHPENHDLWHALAIIKMRQLDFDYSLECFKKCLAINPHFENGLYNYAAVLHHVGQNAEALRTLRNLITLNPNYYAGVFAAAELCYSTGDYWQSVQYFDKYLQIFPHKAAEMLPKIIFALNWAEHEMPDNMDIKLNLLEKCTRLGMDEQAAAVKLRALHCDPQRFVDQYPDDSMALGCLLQRKLTAANWAGLEEYIERLRRAVEAGGMTETVFNLIGTTQEEQYVNMVRYSAWRYPDRPLYDIGAPLPLLDGKITLGYLSSDFHEHATMYLMGSAFGLHDRNRFRVILYSCGIEDSSPVREKIKRECDSFVDLRGLTVEEAARKIKADAVDILVDLKGYNTGNCMDIVALRPAPILVHYLGYPCTLGGPVDYMIADRLTIPKENFPWFSEKIVWLPTTYQINDEECEVGITKTRAEYGLPDKGKVFASFNQNYKVLPDLFDGWMRRLKENPGSVLWQYIFNTESLENLRQEAIKRGVEPGRIVPAVHVNHADHLARFGVVDTFLDTFPVSGHTTMSDALRMLHSYQIAIAPPGVCGKSMMERVASGLLMNRKTIFDTKTRVRELESAYEGMIKRHKNKIPPEHYDIKL